MQVIFFGVRATFIARLTKMTILKALTQGMVLAKSWRPVGAW
jgi:hypothetical protein